MKSARFYFSVGAIFVLLYSCNGEIEIENPKIVSKKENKKEKDSLSDNRQKYRYKESINKYIISGEVDDENVLLSGVKVIIMADGKLDTSVLTNDTGYYELKGLPINKEYQIHFSKKNHLSKYCLVRKTMDEQLDSIGDFPLSVNVSLPEKRFFHSQKTDFTKKEPAAACVYNKSIDNMEWDMKKVAAYKKRLEEARKVRIIQ